jgi:NDP-sugar pyrophosphorylase family protein
MSAVRDAMIVAGGRGTRLAPLTDTTPKPLLPLVGQPFLSGVIRRLATVGVERVLLVVGAETAPFQVLEADAREVGVEVEMVPEPTPLDTAGGARSALERVRGTFLVLNGDILTGLDIEALVERHHEAHAVATLALTRVEDPSSFGVCVLDGDRIVDFVEKPSPGTLPGQDAVNAGTYVLEPEALARFSLGPLSFERTVFPTLVADGEVVVGSVSDAVWADLGTADRYLQGHRLVLDGEVTWPTVTPGTRRHLDVEVEVDATATLHDPVWVGPGTRIGPGATVGPYAVVGRGCKIGAGAELTHAVLHDEVEVAERCRVDGGIVGAGAKLGVDVRVADGGIVGAGSDVPAGEFVAGRSPRPEAEG